MVEPADGLKSRTSGGCRTAISWTRRAALIGWGVILYWREGQLRFDAVWIVYALGFAYMLVLHWYVRHRRVTRTTSWIATVFDSVLTYAMCQANGVALSPILPFFYFTTLAGAFRFGVDELPRVLVLNGGLLVALYLLSEGTTTSEMMLSLFYLGFTFSYKI
jgi:hypothetical protein